jgi:alpha-mannosidase
LAEDGGGSIVRLEEIAGQDSKAQLRSSFFAIDDAWRCSGLEDNQDKLALVDGGVQLSLRPFEIVTLRLRTHSSLPRQHADLRAGSSQETRQ